MRDRNLAHSRAEDVEDFPHLLAEHSSLVVRQLTPELTKLQENKRTNLTLGAEKIDRVVIQPGQIFSFCALVGRTTRKDGYLDGLEMRGEQTASAPGGGLCQMANLIYWMALHLDLEIVERHHHTVDLFPDHQRKVPFGMGATVYYNYRDLRFKNTLDQPIMIRAWVEDGHLRGGFYAKNLATRKIRFEETFHRFARRPDGQVIRENRVQMVIEDLQGNRIEAREIAHNIGLVKYDTSHLEVEELLSDV